MAHFGSGWRTLWQPLMATRQVGGWLGRFLAPRALGFSTNVDQCAWPPSAGGGEGQKERAARGPGNPGCWHDIFDFDYCCDLRHGAAGQGPWRARRFQGSCLSFPPLFFAGAGVHLSGIRHVVRLMNFWLPFFLLTEQGSQNTGT